MREKRGRAVQRPSSTAAWWRPNFSTIVHLAWWPLGGSAGGPPSWVASFQGSSRSLGGLRLVRVRGLGGAISPGTGGVARPSRG
jgi:hypothetical protein